MSRLKDEYPDRSADSESRNGTIKRPVKKIHHYDPDDPQMQSETSKKYLTLCALLPNGQLTKVDLIIDGCYVEKIGEPSKKSSSESPKKKSPRGNFAKTCKSVVLSPEKTYEASDNLDAGGGANGSLTDSHLNHVQGKSVYLHNVLGDDGNLYYCAICFDVGDVVCCDGCPKVYHRGCIPKGCESRRSLDADDDPWFCPECTAVGRARSTSNQKLGYRTSANRSLNTDNAATSDTCSNRILPNEQMSPSEKCGNHGSPVTGHSKRKAIRTRTNENESKRRKYSLDDQCDQSPERPSQLERTKSGIVRAVQPFYYYLLDNRMRLERKLGRRNQLFKSLDKGYEKNLMIAKEGYTWWNKLSESERRRYLKYSIDKFEENVILWKEEEIIKEMYQLLDDSENGNSSSIDDFPDDVDYWRKKAGELVSCSQIKSKQTEGEENTILMELLQDTRFHPLPLMKPTRVSTVVEPQILSEKAVPYFDVQGPIATCIGDQCLGCVRGWNHFCPILGRHFPAVEYRAKLQPPFSSYMATRIGLQDNGTGKLGVSSKMSLSEPSSRNDLVMSFVEKLAAIKLPIGESKMRSHSKTVDQELHLRNIDEDRAVYVCGKCKSVIKSCDGCISCRRASLLISTSEKKEDGDVQFLSQLKTAALRRVEPKIDLFKKRPRSDKVIARALVAKPWKPNAILPPSLGCYPNCKSEVAQCHVTTEGSELNDSSDEDDLLESVKAVDPDKNIMSSKQLNVTKLQSRRHYLRRGFSAFESDKSDASKRAREMAYKEETTKLHAKCLSIATCGILLGLIRRDPLRLFAEPVPTTIDSYHKIIKNPIDFSQIKGKVLRGEYNSLGAFASDIKLLYVNSLVYNPPGTIYATTAIELKDALEVMQRRASDWMSAIKNAHASYYSRKGRMAHNRCFDNSNVRQEIDFENNDDPYVELRKSWPGAIELLEEGEKMSSQLSSSFVRTKENESAYYGAIAIRRIAAAAEASLCPLYESDKIFQPCVRRNHEEDESLRTYIDEEVKRVTDQSRLQDFPSWREFDILGLLRKVQKWRVDKKTAPDGLCGRCVSSQIHSEAKVARYAESYGKRKRADDIQVRVAESRKKQSTGMASKRERERIACFDKEKQTVGQNSVTVRGSQIQGWGLYADHSFQKGEIVAEYVGEYVVNTVTDKREKEYAEGRIQDYQFRVSANLVIDATKHGGFARYINHSCDPNCAATIVDGDPPNQHMKRVIVRSQRPIEAGEEITYDYQFPIELDLEARLPCSCGSISCRGFMNWDLPESTSLISRVQNSGNRKDKVRHLVRRDLNKRKSIR